MNLLPSDLRKIVIDHIPYPEIIRVTCSAEDQKFWFNRAEQQSGTQINRKFWYLVDYPDLLYIKRYIRTLGYHGVAVPGNPTFPGSIFFLELTEIFNYAFRNGSQDLFNYAIKYVNNINDGTKKKIMDLCLLYSNGSFLDQLLYHGFSHISQYADAHELIIFLLFNPNYDKSIFQWNRSYEYVIKIVTNIQRKVNQPSINISPAEEVAAYLLTNNLQALQTVSLEGLGIISQIVVRLDNVAAVQILLSRFKESLFMAFIFILLKLSNYRSKIFKFLIPDYKDLINKEFSAELFYFDEIVQKIETDFAGLVAIYQILDENNKSKLLNIMRNGNYRELPCIKDLVNTIKFNLK